MFDPDVRAKIAKTKYPKQRFYQILKHVEQTSYRECDPEKDGCGYKQPKIAKRSLSITIEHLDQTQEGIRSDQKVCLMADEALKVL